MTQKKLSASYDKKIKTIKEKVLNGTWNTWKTRNIKSYPELFVENFLLSNKIIFEREKYISKKSLGINERNGFFLDFFFKDKKINLEIDGSQHLKPDRLKKDVYRDNLLILNGYKIIRIPWVNIKNKEKQKWFLNQLNELIKILS